jgi:hypothetical protein
VPPSRIAGAIMITDGQVHDVPARRCRLRAPLHALITGEEGERDRRIRFEKAPRFGIVGKPLDLTYRVLDRTGGDAGGRSPRLDQWRADRRAERAFIGQEMPLQIIVPNAGRNIVECRSTASTASSPTQQSRHRAGRRHPREPARAAGLRRAACRRAHLAQPAEVRRLGRPRALHHSASAGKAGRHADQRTVADRLPDARTVRRAINDFDLIIFDRYQHRDVLPILYYDYIAEYVEKAARC